MIPKKWGGPSFWNGKPNPVTLVATVVTRKSSVQASSRFAARKP